MADPQTYADAMKRLSGGGGRRLGSHNFPGAVRPDGSSIMTQNMWIEIANIESKKARTMTLPRERGIDTIFVIDISDSMSGEPFEKAVNFILMFIDIIEGIKSRHRLYENVALVTVGHKTEVLHHLTSDYTTLRAALGSIQVGGRTPMMAGLFMALSAINGRGSITVMNGTHVHPRIILLTDAKFTDSESTSGADSSMYDQEEIDDEIYQLAGRLATESHAIHCVNVGDAENRDILTKIAEVTDGSVIGCDEGEVKKLGRHFKNMAAVTRMRVNFSLSCKNREDFESVVTSYEGDVEQADIDDMMHILQYKLTDPVEEDLDFLDGSAPALGTRVVRGPHWSNANEDGEGPGTIVRHSRKQGFVTVEWDLTRVRGEYSHHEGKKQIVIKPVERVLMEDDLIAPGCLVCRGDDWQWGFQDGGPENIGVVYDVQQSGLVHVRWPNGHCNWYRFGAEGMFDVKIWEPSSGQNEFGAQAHSYYSEESILPPKSQMVPSASSLQNRQSPITPVTNGPGGRGPAPLSNTRLTTPVNNGPGGRGPTPLSNTRLTTPVNNGPGGRGPAASSNTTLTTPVTNGPGGRGTTSSSNTVTTPIRNEPFTGNQVHPDPNRNQHLRPNSTPLPTMPQLNADTSGPQTNQLHTDGPSSLSDQNDFSSDHVSLVYVRSKSIIESSYTDVKTPKPIQNVHDPKPDVRPKVFSRPEPTSEWTSGTTPVVSPDAAPRVTSDPTQGVTYDPTQGATSDPTERVTYDPTQGAPSDPTQRVTSNTKGDTVYLEEDIEWCWLDKKRDKWVPFSEANTTALEEAKKKTRKCKNVKIHDSWYRVFLNTMKMQLVNSRESTSVKRAVIPRAIKGMRKELVDKYMKLLAKGSYLSSNIRLMVVGNDRVGKTTLCRNMLKDKRFGNTDGTDGIDVFVNSYKINTRTKEKNKLKGTEHTIAIEKLASATIYGKPGAEEEEEEEIPMEGEEQPEVEDTDSVPHFPQPATPQVTSNPVHELENKIEQIHIINQPIAFSETTRPVKGKPRRNFVVNERTGEISIPEYVKRDVDCILEEADKLQKAGMGKDEEDIAYLSMWDFGGEKIFYDSHHIFLSKDAVYLLCFDVKKYQEDNDLEPILFWLRSIATYSECTGKSKGPPIILIGTHTDQMEGTDKEKEDAFSEICSRITLHTDVAPIKGQIMNYFCVDNSKVNDEKFDNILDAVIEAAPYQSQWKMPVPTKWLALEREIMKKKKDKIKTFEEIVKMDQKMEAPIGNEEDIRMFLRYLHLMGYIMYFDEDVGLDGPHRFRDLTIIIDPQWVIYAFRRLITNPKNIKGRGCGRKVLWNQYIKDGHLTTPLIDELWSKRKGETEEENFFPYKDILLKVMERLGLLAPPVAYKSLADCPENLDYYIVPSMLSDVDDDFVKQFLSSDDIRKTKTLRLTLGKQFISLPVFHKLLAHCLTKFKLPSDLDLPAAWSSKFRPSDCFKKGFGLFEVTPVWNLILAYDNSAINVTLFTYSDEDYRIEAGAGLEVRTFLEETIKTVLTLQGQNTTNLTCKYFLGCDILQQQGTFVSREDIDKIDDTHKIFRGGEYLGKLDLKPWFCSEEEKGTPIPVAYFLPSHYQNLSPTDQHLTRISNCINLNNSDKRRFGMELGLEGNHITTIINDYDTDTVEQIYQMLVKWKTLYTKCKIGDIIKVMKKLGLDCGFFYKKGKVFDKIITRK